MSEAKYGTSGANQDRRDLSFIIEASGRIMPVLPDGNEFSLAHMHDYLAGPPELLCRTRDGFFLFRNKEAQTHGLPVNELATAIYLEFSPPKGGVVGRAFVAHPDHIATYMKTK